MTQEYIETLRRSLEAAANYIEHITPSLPNNLDKAMAMNVCAELAKVYHAPIPPAPLRPMSEAPRDGRKLLAYTLDRSPVIVWANRGEETRWTHSDGTMEPKWLLGWTIEAAIQAAEEIGCQS